MAKEKVDVLQGTLALMILRTLDSMGRMHGYGVARRIEQIAEGMLFMNQGTLYPALLRLEQQKWISSEWGVSENNRKAKFYRITKAGKKQLDAETENWERVSSIVSRFLSPAAGER